MNVSIKTRVVLFAMAVMLTQMTAAQSTLREEFNGPFASWANVKTRFKAKGDGVTDDTRALQTAIDSLSVGLSREFNMAAKTRYHVIYLPAGTYRISSTLRVEGKIGFTIVGEDPKKTIVKWVGKANDTMLVANGSSYYKIGRLTWDGSKLPNMEGLGVHWLEKQRGIFSATSVELSDMMFTGGLAYGIFGGTYGSDGTGANDAEIVIRRCVFQKCSAAGIAIKGYNALDYWIWDCTFTDCTRGLECSKGNYNIYNSQFYRSVESDIVNDDGYYTSARNCYSKDSKMFSFDKGASCNAFKRIFQKNYIDGYAINPIEYHSQGRVTLLDNIFYKRAASGDYRILNYSSWCNTMYEVLSMGNQFEKYSPFYLGEYRKQVFTGLDQHASGFKTNFAKPPAPAAIAFAPLVKRKVFEVPSNAGAAQIQNIINEAAKLKGARPIVHLGPGVYILDREITIPADADLQLIGDGIFTATTFRKKAGSSNPYFFIVKGPSYITMQEFQLDNQGANNAYNGVVFQNIDQERSEVHIDQIYSEAKTTLATDRLNYTYIEKNNSFYSSGHELTGGDKVKTGKGTAVLYCFGAQSARTTLKNNAVMVAKDCWWEGAAKKEYLPLDLNGEGRFTLDGSMISPRDLDSSATIRINNFSGAVTIADTYMYGGIDVNNDKTDLKVLVWNVNMINKIDAGNFVRNRFRPALAMLGITTQCNQAQNPNCKSAEIISPATLTRNVTNLNGYLEDMTSDIRKSMPRPFRNMADKISNVYIARICVTGVNTALRFSSN